MATACKKLKLCQSNIICIFIMPHKIQNARLKIMKNSAIRSGFKIVDTFSEEVSHVVSEWDSIDQVERHLAGHCLNGAITVKTAWLTACLREGTLLPVTDHYKLHNESKLESPCSSTSQPVIPDWACQRVTPLHHYNEKYTNAFAILEKHADFTDEYSRSLAFCRAASVLKSLPKTLTHIDEIKTAHHIGKHSLKVIQDILENGMSTEAEKIASSQWFKTMEEFTGVFGVGPSTASKWIEAGCNSIKDVVGSSLVSRRADMRVQLGLAFHNDLIQPVSRSEADSIVELIRQRVQQILPGATVELTGGFRRGKSTGHDVDLLLSHPTEGKEIGLLQKLLNKLVQENCLLYGTHEKSTFTNDAIKTESQHKSMRGQLDHFEKWIGIMKVGGTSKDTDTNSESRHSCELGKDVAATPNQSFDAEPVKRINRSLSQTISQAKSDRDWIARRVDLIVAPQSQYYYALVGWIGSKHFNRDLRLYAKKVQNCMLTSHGCWDYKQGISLPASSQEDVFSNLKIEYREPSERNC